MAIVTFNTVTMVIELLSGVKQLLEFILGKKLFIFLSV